jgi:hypothetical protein
MLLTAADMDYTNNLEFYQTVKEASKRRIDGAETLYKKMETRFKTKKQGAAEPTIKQQEKDAKAIIRGKKEGTFFVEKEKPHLVGGKNKVIDETFNDTAKFKEDVEGSIKE